MRDPNRIDPILAELGKTWHLNPDLRLGQLLKALYSYAGWLSDDLFYAEDTVIQKALSIKEEQDEGTT